MLCDEEWYRKHKDDYTEADIAALSIEVLVDKKKRFSISQGGEKDKVKKVLKGYGKRQDQVI